MKLFTQETAGEDNAPRMSAPAKYEMAYPELCSEFLTTLAKSIKNAALYTLSHPVVLESLRKDSSLLETIFAANGAEAITLSFVDDVWLFNETAVPAVTPESRNLSAFFKAHRLHGLTFAAGVRPFELGALCEFLGAPARNQPEGYTGEFFAARGIENIRAESVRYVHENSYPAGRPEGAAPRRAEPAPKPVSPPPAPAAARPVPAPAPARPPARPAPRPERAQAAAAPPQPRQESALANMSFGGILKGLVESAVKDPKDRVQAYEDALKMIRETMDQQVAESTRALAEEKENALKTRTRTERVLNKVAEGKVIVDKEGKILMMNQVAEEIAGMKFADAAGRHISEHIRPGEHFLTISRDMDLTGGKQVSGEVELNGDELMGRTLRRSVALLEDAEGRVVGAYSTLPELTKYKEAQHMQEEFLSRVTHDLQSPLSSITSALEILTDAAGKKLNPAENKFLEISIRNSRRLSQMIRGILDFSKLEAGKMDVHLKPSSVAPILAEAGEGLLPWARTKGITLIVRPAAAGLCALADAPRIVQVLTNLISNAIKATPAGGTVVVAAGPDPKKADGLIFGVRDTGRGIPKEDMDRIFEKFVQLPSHDAQEGVGLGLAIVNDFLQLHHGRIWAASEAGKGATFYFTLPRAEACPLS